MMWPHVIGVGVVRGPAKSRIHATGSAKASRFLLCGGPCWTVPGLPSEKKEPIPALQQLLLSYQIQSPNLRPSALPRYGVRSGAEGF